MATRTGTSSRVRSGGAVHIDPRVMSDTADQPHDARAEQRGSPSAASSARATAAKPPWYDRVLGTKRPSRWFQEAIDDVVDGVDYGETPLPWEQSRTWTGKLFGPGLHYFRKFFQAPLIRAIHWPILKLADLGWYSLRGLSRWSTEFCFRWRDMRELSQHSQRLRRVREIAMSQPRRIKEAIEDKSVFGASEDAALLRQAEAESGVQNHADLQRLDVYHEFVGVALTKPRLVALLHEALTKER